MFWIVTGVVVVVLLALAWWSSGRVKTPNTVDFLKRDTIKQGKAGR